jgi:gliding motility-associated protein GldC
MATHKSEIKFEIGLDDNKVPESIEWSAEDGGMKHAAAKAMLLSVWDKKSGDTLKIDLWTKEMMADEMKKFVHQSFMALADTLERSANETEAANEMREFGKHLGEKMGLLRKK